MMGLLGGMGTLVGPLMGTAIVIFLGDLLSTWLKEAWMLCLGGLYVVCVLFSPEGLTEIISKLSATRLLSKLFGREDRHTSGN
jgi:branched-chain amino acid transport system permease protein